MGGDHTGIPITSLETKEKAMRFDSQNHAAKWYRDFFEETVRIVRGDAYRYVRTSNQPNGYQYVCVYKGRDWFKRETQTQQLHPAVAAMMLRKCYMPANWAALLLEWPHRAVTDHNRLAYTRDERAGEADRQTITTIGKYLTRHFPHAPDDVIRDMVAEHTYGGAIYIERDLDAMVQAVLKGPASCMSHPKLIRMCADGIERHPYAVYAPSLGWSMAVRKASDGEILGRCLVWHDADSDERIFVRSYKRERDERSHSGRDEAIETWLTAQGYERRGEWPDGTPLMCYELSRSRSDYIMPYIDGNTRSVDLVDGGFEIDSRGNYSADNTDGTVSDGDTTCDSCGDRYNSENEGGYVGVHGDICVCGHCLDHDYTHVYGRRGDTYYVSNDDAIEVSGEYYDINYLSDNSIVELHDGEYEHLDNAVFIASEDAYYHCDDDDICYAEDSNQYELTDNCWQCTESGDWYTEDEDYVEVDGDKYHPDHAPETETNDDEEEDEDDEIVVTVQFETNQPN